VYDYEIASLQRKKPAAANYLASIDHTLWVNGLIPGGVERRCGQRTSNAVENLNNMVTDLRELGIFELLDGIWHWEMGVQQARVELALTSAPGQILTPCYQTIINDDTRMARLLTVIRGPDDTGFVHNVEQKRFAVDLRVRTCCCKQFQLNLLPCSHALALILELGVNVLEYMLEKYTYACWSSTYR